MAMWTGRPIDQGPMARVPHPDRMGLARMPGEFSRYHVMVNALARRALALPHAPGASLSLALPAARVLVQGPSSSAADDLPRAFRALAALASRAHANEGEHKDKNADEAGADPLSDASAPGMPRLTDAHGHHRDVYYPLAVHLLLAAYRRCYETLPVGAWSACEELSPVLVAPLRVIERWADARPPADQTALALWSALGLYGHAQLASRDVDVELADSVVHHVLGPALDEGPLHPMREDESLDAWTWRELTGLHALANLAVCRRHQVWAERVERIALYHQENTQPDNVTSHPWAVFAFLWSSRTRSVGEQQLHDVSTVIAAAEESGGGVGMLSGLLLADAGDTLGAFGTVGSLA